MNELKIFSSYKALRVFAIYTAFWTYYYLIFVGPITISTRLSRSRYMSTVDASALGDAQRKRVNDFVRSFEPGDRIALEQLFASQRVAKTVKEEKLVINGFDPEKLLGALPFSSTIYAPICSECVRPEHYPQFKTLVKSGLVVPVLVGSYKFYNEELRDFIVAHDHVSYWEFAGYRVLRVTAAGDETLCRHCLGKREDDLFKKISGRKNADDYKDALRRFINHLAPLPVSDSEILELGIKYYQQGKLKPLRQLVRMSNVIDQIRVGEAFNSPVLLEDSDLARLPENISLSGNEARAQAAKINKMVAEGLGISIPTDLRLETYIELVKDYQPQISKAIRAVLGSKNYQASVADASKSIIAINSEIERIKSSRRYAVLEAGISFYQNNSTLVNGTLLAGALGLTGSLIGCVATGGAALGAKVAKSKGWLKSTPATERMRHIVARDLQPMVDLVLKPYLGATTPAVSVLSLQKRIASAKRSNVLHEPA